VSATVLVVDDNLWARRLLCSALQKHGYDTEQAADLAGVRQLQRRCGPGWQVNLVLVELVRERGNGFTVAAWLQSRGLGTVVLLSERQDNADRLWARSRGILHMLSRADGVGAMCARINDILAGRENACQASDDRAGRAPCR
jgi:DNA-binding response OmpR family regulator